ncbi:MAG: DUF6603 domain-containing protein [Steroidobacteraceae bacterium]
MDDALSIICSEFMEALAPLINAAEDPDALLGLLADLGWTPNSVPKPLQALADAGADLIDLIGTDPDDLDTTDALGKVAQVITAINAIVNNPDATFPGGIDVAAFKATIGRELLDYVVVEHLLSNHQRIGGLLKLAGLIRLIPVPAAGLRQTYLKREVEWSQLGDLFTDPAQGFNDVFSWNTVPKLPALMADLTSLLESYLLSLDYFVPPDGQLAFINQGATAPPGDVVGLGLALYPSLTVPLGVQAGIQFAIRPATAVRGPAISAFPYASLNAAQQVNLSDSISVSIRGNADFSQGISITLAPGRQPELQAGFLGGGAITTPGEAQLTFKLSPLPGDPERILIGTADATRFAVSTAELSIGAHVLNPSQLEALAEVAVDGAHIVIKPSADDADSFLTTFIPDNGLDATFSFGLRFSSVAGFQFTGAGGLEISIPVHVQLGPIDFEQVVGSVTGSGGGLEFDLGATVTGELGPLEATVDGIGFSVIAQFKDPPQGNLGPVQVDFAFKPPKGVGLSLDAGTVTGGGYLYFDSTRGQYAGALELMVADWLQLSAIGLITTKIPDGSKGFSLLVIITADFGSGLQLGFGFALIGVGGLLGLNRTMLFQPLMDGVRTGSIDGILFPTDVVANAPKIISDLQAIFPPQENTFLIGPMAKLGWGTPTLISGSLGVIIEIPPADVAILGVIQLALPDPDDVILLLQVNFAGALEFDKKRLYFFASLYDSRILFITIQGELGLLMAYGSDANFVLSVGGFNPQFNPPPLPFPTPNRVQLDILNESYARVRAEGYFAVTSNTAQFGAQSEYFFGFSAVSVTGHSGFDALFQFSPFYFIVDASTAFSANVFGIGVFSLDIDLTLSGPRPWHAHGTASIGFLFFSIGIGIDVTWGDSRDTTLPPIAVMPILVAELGKSANWRAQLPSGSNLLVSLRQLDPSDTTLVLHPVGTLRVSQRAVPLDLTLDKDGNQTLSDANHFHLDVTPGGLARNQDLQEPFAPAQFRNFSDADKLSQAAYTPQNSGIELAASGSSYATGTAITRNVRYELTVIDTQYRRYVKPFFVYLNSLFLHFLGGASVARNAFSAAKLNQMQPWTQKIVVSNETFAVANLADNSAFSGSSVGFSSRVSAQDYLNRTLAAQPSLNGTLHVLGQYELAA